MLPEGVHEGYFVVILGEMKRPQPILSEPAS